MEVPITYYVLFSRTATVESVHQKNALTMVRCNEELNNWMELYKNT